jgi:thiamine biosynthesis lipoprotein
LADALSTALFAMPYEDGLEIVQKIGNVEVLWITMDGKQYTTPGIENLVKK